MGSIFCCRGRASEISSSGGFQTSTGEGAGKTHEMNHAATGVVHSKWLGFSDVDFGYNGGYQSWKADRFSSAISPRRGDSRWNRAGTWRRSWSSYDLRPMSRLGKSRWCNAVYIHFVLI